MELHLAVPVAMALISMSCRQIMPICVQIGTSCSQWL